ncbi:hypothetical protein [Jannaschia aquimarina]|uniref:ribonucleoside-diphosphate reductase n=1 Tax=Jannaschia aquimarina TaxID=935700 RepID=A0A0D1ECU7_9RHOB|nr:hypothetical protein [Jannaschia aquimarina]KIT14756.1 hypothetical protein jaqu_35170 [Jannaschia aquimarina]SNT42020.1 hypothetical protein SAMN05421775_1186 [Jannaschia aquimarina]
MTAAPDPNPQSDRQRPSNRRLLETRKVEHVRPDGNVTRILVTVGYDPTDPARPIEVFYSEGFRSGSDIKFTVQDACVLISLLLQHGVPPERIASSMATRESEDADLTSGAFARRGDGPVVYGSLAGTIAAQLAVPPGWAEEAE